MVSTSSAFDLSTQRLIDIKKKLKHLQSKQLERERERERGFHENIIRLKCWENNL
jgi:hypothetical protein